MQLSNTRQKIQSIEFEEQKDINLIITLKNGKSTKGEINKLRNNKLLAGFFGESGKGQFYIERKYIKTIGFY